MAYDYFSPDGNAGRTAEPKFDTDSFSDLIFDEDGKGHPATISYESFTYDGAVRVCKLVVSTSLGHVQQEDVLNLLSFREGKRIELECQMQLL